MKRKILKAVRGQINNYFVHRNKVKIDKAFLSKFMKGRKNIMILLKYLWVKKFKQQMETTT